MVFTHNIFNSLQDVSWMPAKIAREEEPGRVSGFMYGAKYFGMFLGGAVFSRILSVGGLSSVFWQMVLLTVILLFPLLRERAGERLLPWTKGSVQLKATRNSRIRRWCCFAGWVGHFCCDDPVGRGHRTRHVHCQRALGPMMQVLLLQDLLIVR